MTKHHSPKYLTIQKGSRDTKPKASETRMSKARFQGFKMKGKLSYGINICKWDWNTSSCVVSLSCLLDLGFHHTIASNGISVSLNGIFYFSAISVNGVFEIDMNNNVPKNNNNSIFSINKKRKLDLDSSYLWHCRLAHIGKTRMQKLHREGLLENIDEESFDKCESCISGKMTKKPFNKNIERATDLLGLIHTDVCGPLRHVSRKGASYFLTFTDDFSHYGYVYLLKHKHEVFETFKVFKAEVELQLGKKIKALRSDRGGEYLSQEFKDYLKSAVRILNMVPTKKVDKTPYETWQSAEFVLFKGYPKETMGYYFYFPPENKSNCCRYGDFLERDLISQEFSRRDYDLEDDHMDTLPSENTSEIPVEPESLGSPSELIPVRRSERTKRAPNRLCLNMEVEDDEVGDLGEPANYKTACLTLIRIVKDISGKCFSVEGFRSSCLQSGDIKIYRDRSLRLIGLNQSAYIDKILKKFSMQNSKKGFIPMEVKHDLSNEMCASSDEEKAYMKKVPYASAVGSVMYAGRCTRPDVEFAQNLVSRYQHNPGKLHWVALKHILKYLRNTKDMFLVYGGNPDTELDVTEQKATTIAMHATQSEYMATSEAAMEAVWIRKFVGDLVVMPSINKPINMYCDNSAAIIFANEPGVMKGARHFLRRYHYVREQVESGEIKLIKVHTDKNLADAFTKAL
ncbi:retrotransposon protein, putative, ty1-copia subclass [Tanacetum coccineum]